MAKLGSEIFTTPFKTLLPPYRFIPTDETILHRPHQPSPLNEKAIRVLNWNIAKNNHDRSWQKDFDWIVDRYQPDLIFLQEVQLCTELKHFELAELGWSFAPNFIDTYRNIYAGVLTASRASCVTRKAVLTEHAEPVSNTPKVSLVTEHPFAQGTLLTINSHLINFVELDKFKTQLVELETAIAAHDGAIIFSGDFNTWNRSRWQLLDKMTRRLGLSRAKFSEADTQNIKRFLMSPPLDHIFYRGLHQNYLQARVLDQIQSSDHKPMLVEFHL
ncbi:endonuclease/exonuclease/phosphatase family protein [Leptolyngbya boryana CZ1]|uniref:Endonuclease/exonuclease/phosphatase family protein n=1 Tax=Leptolyngbya boryana CZ1 TaxID=3060204 RepID=A0AA96WS85_LEPBY|nr:MULTISPECIES: endonuclease/exonuclease/phosphatase family protein [Leptolyngbya]MBN8562440.1 endonuclease/exonuclease/phosphatase family protein [Leptolyngbya sp. UWPOB_LEPTO1]WNZ44503.1 endonuclease/exonuclease/phosphatase family protein [Leptolyngbya boryana CZ1]